MLLHKRVNVCLYDAAALSMAESLLRHGADPAAGDGHGTAALDWMRGCIHFCVCSDCLPIVYPVRIVQL